MMMEYPVFYLFTNEMEDTTTEYLLIPAESAIEAIDLAKQHIKDNFLTYEIGEIIEESDDRIIIESENGTRTYRNFVSYEICQDEM